MEKFVEYYRWIDYSLTNFLNQLVPATSDFGQNIKNVVESHALERNKYQHKVPNIRIKDLDIVSSAVSLGEASYNWSLADDWFARQEQNSLNFASNGSVSVSDDDDLSHSNSPDAPFAISLWINPASVSGGTQTLLTKPGEYTVKVNNDDVQFTLFTNASNHTTISANNVLSTDWTSVVVTYDGTLDESSPSATPRKIYINGTAATAATSSSGTYAGMSNTSSNLIIGADDASGTNNFGGLIADVVMVTGSELSAAQALEIYTGGQNFDVTKYSRYSDVIAWWKMGDDQDLASGSGAVKDYVGTHNGTPSGINISTTTRVYKHYRDLSPTDVRFELYKSIGKDIPNSLESERWKTKLLKTDSSVNLTITTGMNKISHQPLVSLQDINNGKSIVFTKSQIEQEINAKVDSLLPFAFTSASNGVIGGSLSRNFPITNNHLDLEISSFSSMKGPFPKTHTGGMFHRRVPFGTTAAERPEAYSLNITDNSLTVSPTPINKPKSMFFRGVSGTRFMNIANIRHEQIPGAAGNYSKIYEVLQTSGRNANNRYFVKQSTSWLDDTPTPSTHLEGVVDFQTPQRTRSSHIITNRFSALGGSEVTTLTRDRNTEEFSVYNTINYRNKTVRDAQNIISSEHAEQFGFRSGSQTQGSLHKINRNPKRFILGSNEEVRYDNEFVKHSIPQSDYQYNWISKTVDDTVYDFLQRNENNSFVNNNTLLSKVYLSDFSGAASGTVLSGWKTSNTEKSSVYAHVEKRQLIEVTASSGELSAPGARMVSSQNLLVSEDRVYRKTSSGYQLEYTIDTRHNVDAFAINETEDLVAAIVHTNASSTSARAIDIHRSSSTGWSLEASLTGAFDSGLNSSTRMGAIFFSGSSVVYGDLTSSSSRKKISWFASSSSGWGSRNQSTVNTGTDFLQFSVNWAYDPQVSRGLIVGLNNIKEVKYNSSSSQWVVHATHAEGTDESDFVAYDQGVVAIGFPGIGYQGLGIEEPEGFVRFIHPDGKTNIIQSPDLDFVDGFGSSIDFSGSFVAIGAPKYDIVFDDKVRREETSDKGALYLYRISPAASGSATWASLQNRVYSRVENPRDFSKYASSIGFVGPDLAVETPGEATFIGSSGADFSTHIDIYTVASSTSPVDRSLLGPIISGSSSRALLLKGESVFSNEVNQFPSDFKDFTGNKFRILETSTGIAARHSEFVIKLEVIEGSNSSSDVSNSQYGLVSSPTANEKILVQYKIGSSAWVSTSILIAGSNQTGLQTQNNFTSYTSEPIKNSKMEDVHIRLVSNVSNKDSDVWGVKNISLNPSHVALRSSENLVEVDSFRRDLLRSNQKEFDVLYFTNGFMSQLTNLHGQTPLGVRSGDHDSGLHWGNGSSDHARSLQIWVKHDDVLLEDQANTRESVIAQLYGGGNASQDPEGLFYYQYGAWQLAVEHSSGKFKFVFRLQDASGNDYEIKTTSTYDKEEWYHVCVTYDGNGTTTVDGLKIYINGVKASVTNNRTTTSYSHMYHHADLILMLGVSHPPQTNMLSFIGKMKYLAQFNKELTAAEVRELQLLRNNASENYSIISDPLRMLKTSVASNLAALWPFNKQNLQIEGSHGYSIYTDLVSGYELVAETYPNSNVPKYRRLAPFNVSEKVDKITGFEQAYEIENYTTIVNKDDRDYLKNSLSPYHHGSWTQIRASEMPALRKQKRENKITISVRDQEVFPISANTYYHDLNPSDSRLQSYTMTSARDVEVYDEVNITTRYSPLILTINGDNVSLTFDPTELTDRLISQQQYRKYWENNQSFSSLFNQQLSREDARMIIVKASGPNDLSMFSNEDLNEKLELDEYKTHNISQIIAGMQDLARSEGGSLEIGYKETLYPREVNAFTKRARTRSEFDYFSWRKNISDRANTLGGSNQYGTTLVNLGASRVFPDITVDTLENKKNNHFFVDSRNVSNRLSRTASTTKIKSSRWPLDSRTVPSSLPANIDKSYHGQGDLFFTDSEIATKGEGTLQNDYSIFGLGYNGLYGTPPVSALYTRRIPQTISGLQYLAGDAQWEAPEQSGRQPYESSDDTTERLKRLWQDHSLVPEYRVSDFVEDIVLKHGSDFSKVVEEPSYLSIEGAIYNTSSQEVSVGSKFFKTYGTTEFMKYFGMVMEEVEDNAIGGPTQLTLKCNAAVKFTPYRGFYPAERALQIGEIFSRGYMPEFSIIDARQTAADRNEVTSPTKMVERKIRANLQQTIKPFMAPGILFNSIKTGMAVDYPIFGSQTDHTALTNFNTAIKQQFEPYTSFHSSLSSLSMFTGSAVNNSIDDGIPRLSGSVLRRITFEDLLEPQRVVGQDIFDNEPHPSASIYYGDAATTKVFDYPYKFGELESSNNQDKLFADRFLLKKTLDDTLTPYKMAINNFCAETVNFFLEGGKLASIESDQVNPILVSGTVYKMRVHVKNNSLVMYDRHSSFGPPVDEGKNLVFSKISGALSTTLGQAASASLGVTDVSIAATDIGTTNFTLTDASNKSLKVYFTSSGSLGSNSTGSYGPGNSVQYDVSAYGKVMIQTSSSFIDLSSVESSGQNVSTAINKLLEVAINKHRWNGNLDIEANFIENNISLRQLTTGTAGNKAIAKVGSISSIFPSFPTTFAGGTANSTNTTGVTTTQITESVSHEFAPFVPPYLNQGAEPYVEISYTATESRAHTLEEILQDSSYTYINFKDVPSNASVNTNYLNAMSISASLDLRNFVAYEQPAQQDPGTTLEQRKRWVIQTKWETPILNFREAKVSALNLSSSALETVSDSPWQTRTWNQYLTKSTLLQQEQYLTSSTGMWHQYGSTLNSNEGYTISIRKMENISEEQQLAKKVGFLGEDLKPVSVTPGKIAEKKEISEAVVAIPFYIHESTGKMKLFTVKDRLLNQARNMNKKKKQEYNDAIRGVSRASQQYSAERQQYLDFYNNPGVTGKESIAYQMRMMEKFVFPPQFDYYTYPDLSQKPMMYIFQFNAEFTKQDLANIWQNLSPESEKSGATPRHSSVDNPEVNGIRQDIQYVSNFLTKKNLPWSQRQAFIKEDVRWLVFKVKQRASDDLAKIKINSFEGSQNNLQIDYARTSVKMSDYLSDKKYSYNWPYDYFSLVELIKIDGKIDFSPLGDDGTR